MTDDAASGGNDDAGNTGLASCEILAELSAEEIRTMEKACHWLRLPTGRILFRHEDPPAAVYFVISGLVRAFLPMQDGKEINYAEFGPGEMFGELAAIDGKERSADVITVTDSLVAACPRPLFHQFIRDYPSLSLRLLVRLAGMVRQSSQRIAEFSALTDVQRVYVELLRIANPDPSGNGSWVLRPAPLHKDIAAWAGTTTDVVGRAIGHLMKAELVQRRVGALYILDRKRVELLSRPGTGGSAA
ncbi:MAG: Crp/Fnr family transcriptional regulator [Rhodospirillaceae bacterium]